MVIANYDILISYDESSLLKEEPHILNFCSNRTSLFLGHQLEKSKKYYEISCNQKLTLKLYKEDSVELFKGNKFTCLINAVKLCIRGPSSNKWMARILCVTFHSLTINVIRPPPLNYLNYWNSRKKSFTESENQAFKHLRIRSVKRYIFNFQKFNCITLCR